MCVCYEFEYVDLCVLMFVVCCFGLTFVCLFGVYGFGCLCVLLVDCLRLLNYWLLAFTVG